MAVLTGSEGVGKSVICRAVLDELDRRTFTALVAGPFVSAERMLARLLAELGVLSSEEVGRGRLGDATRAELAGALRDFLTGLQSLGAFAVIAVDDAHEVPLDVLEELAALTGGGSSQVMLIGRPQILKKLEQPTLQALAARGRVRCSAPALTAEEVAPYVRHRLAVAGRHDATLFDASAYAQLARSTRGVPRLVNLLREQAIFEGHRALQATIDRPLIERVAASLRVARPSSRRWRFVPLAALLLLTVLAFLLG